MNAAPVQFLTATPRRRSNGGGPAAGNESTSRGTRLHSTDRGQDADAFAESLLQRAARLRLPELFGRPRPEAVTGQHRDNRKGRPEMTRRIMQLKRASARTRVSAAEAGRGNYRASLPIAAGAALAMLIALVQAAPIQAASGVGARPLPDLTVSAVSDSPSAIEVGTPFTITATTTNAGKRPAQASLTRFYLSPDAVLGASDVSLSGELAVGKLKKRHSRTASVALTLGATPAPGTYSLLACADDTKLVAESDETDNCRASAGTVSFGPPPDPIPVPDPPPDPDPDPDPPPSGDSSQALIQADLDTGLISYETSLIYRTLALFGDPRLPSRYQAAPSSGEDQALFAEFEANLASLSAEAQTTIEPYLLPPNDPASAWGVQPATVTRAGFAEALAADDPLPFPPDLKCDASWRHTDWTPPGGAANDGFRIWGCAASEEELEGVASRVKTAADALWGPMTQPEPNGMGRPVPDTVNNNPANHGNGKIDIFVLYSRLCVDPNCPLGVKDGKLKLGVARQLPTTLGAPGHPPTSTSGYIIVNAGAIAGIQSKPTIAHEFFHILQMAHNRKAWYGSTSNGGPESEASWYVEASAQWAGWYYAQDPDAYTYFSNHFQQDNLSLLEATNSNQHLYASWIWPLFMQHRIGASAVFQSWEDAENATAPVGIDNAVNSQLSFDDEFRDFSVRNLNPADYDRTAGDTGLEDDTWQSRIESFPTDSHLIVDAQTIGLSGLQVPIQVDALAAQDNFFDITDANVRQVKIDLGMLENAGTADLDIVGRLANTGAHEWRRLREDSSSRTFCRDIPAEDFDRLYVVVSNHSSSRDADHGGPDPGAALKGSYSIEAKDHCDIPIRYEGTFKLIERSSTGPSLIDFTAVGNVTFKYSSTEATCGSFVPPTADSLQYCYYLESAQETWTAPNISTEDCNYFPHEAQFSYANDGGSHGGIRITLRSPDPTYSNIYSLWFGSNAKTMEVDTTDVFPHECNQEDTFTIRLPFYSLTSLYPPATAEPRFAGWPLQGSLTVDVGQTVLTTVTWSWDLSPIFEE